MEASEQYARTRSEQVDPKVMICNEKGTVLYKNSGVPGEILYIADLGSRHSLARK